MTQPVIAKNSPYGIELKPGNYFWCKCGLSASQPFCDGSHKNTEFTPDKFVIDETRKVFLCGCKQSAKAPFCDGTHNQLDAQ